MGILYFDDDAQGPITTPAARTLYRIAQEGNTNIDKDEPESVLFAGLMIRVGLFWGRAHQPFGFGRIGVTYAKP